MMREVAQPLGLTLEDAAEGVIRIANANMARAIRAVSTERGYDLAQFALFAYGGAGPLHAIDIAEECGIASVLIPVEPGTMCARGMLLADVSFDFVRSLIRVVDEQSWPCVLRLFEQMRGEASGWLEREQVVEVDRRYEQCIDARYQGQNFEVVVAVDALAEHGLARFIEGFAQVHRREYGYDIPGRPVEIVNCRLKAIGRVPKAPLTERPPGGDLAHSQVDQRDVYFGRATGWRPTPVYARERMGAGLCIKGPAVIEEMSATAVLGPGQAAHIDRFGNIVVRVRSEG
jgi:N-methylhydantoinase A